MAVPLLAMLWMVPHGGCGKTGGDECSVETFGRQCAGEEEYLTCGRTSCEDAGGLPCSPRAQVNEHRCPASRPRCVQRRDQATSAPEIACLGEIVGGCAAVGFVRCEGDDLEVVCVLDEQGIPALSQGRCATEERCHAPFPLHAGGCTGLKPPG